MGLMHEDFIRCVCGHADFKEVSIVTIPKTQKKRDDFHQHEPISNIGKKIVYECEKCGKRIDI